MHKSAFLVAAAAALLSLNFSVDAQAQQPFAIDDLVRLHRLSDLQLSPDGRYLAFTVRETDMDANKGRTDVWLLDLSKTERKPRRLTQHEASDSTARWSHDGRAVYFLSTRSGSSQIWRQVVKNGEKDGEPAQTTKLPLDIGSFGVSPKGDRLLLTMEVFPDCADLACSAQRLTAASKSPASGQTYDRLFVRHWDTWGDGTIAQLFSVGLNNDGSTRGTPVSLTGKLDADVPSKPFGDDEDYAFSADGTRVVFSARVKAKDESWSTNFDLYEVPTDGSAAPRNLTADNRAWDAQPVFSPDGRWLAWTAMEKPGFEADRFHLVLRDLKSGEVKHLTRDWDRSIAKFTFSQDSRRILATTYHLGQHPLWSIDLQTGKATALISEGYVDDFVITPKQIVYGMASLAQPIDLYAIDHNGGRSERLTQINAEKLGARRMGEFEQFTFKGWNDETVYGFAMKPANFTAGKKYPVAFIIHGGPQSSFGNNWSYRWNPQIYAGAGYGVVFIDFHGSVGYGQKFTDSISGDWGGKPLEDLQKGLAAALEKYTWLDGTKACALGASYGGYMINWIAGQWPDRFRCLVNHDGVFDQRMMYYSTEELWFPEWEHGGPYYQKQQDYERHNPINHVDKWKTPMLVIHGGLDFRVPDTQGLGAFTALQRRGVESRLLYFPNENHWVLKPHNSVQWHKEVLGWLNKWTQ